MISLFRMYTFPSDLMCTIPWTSWMYNSPDIHTRTTSANGTPLGRLLHQRKSHPGGAAHWGPEPETSHLAVYRVSPLVKENAPFPFFKIFLIRLLNFFALCTLYRLAANSMYSMYDQKKGILNKEELMLSLGGGELQELDTLVNNSVVTRLLPTPKVAQSMAALRRRVRW